MSEKLKEERERNGRAASGGERKVVIGRGICEKLLDAFLILGLGFI